MTKEEKGRPAAKDVDWSVKPNMGATLPSLYNKPNDYLVVDIF
jgi:hypothetical protein